MKKQLQKSASFTDIHFGAKANSELHNQDCIRFVDWFCEQVRNDPTIDHINFLGDYFENRSQVNISTLSYAYEGIRRVNELGLPVFFVIGNHDLYHRHTREIYTPIIFGHFNNVTVINEPVVVKQVGDGGALYSPYLFPQEYPSLIKHLNLKTWWGHFEFKGFIVTGYNKKMEVGPESDDFKGPKYIFSGHFHKRQKGNNVVYMGNAFPFTFNDAGDNERGMMVYDHATNTPLFQNWDDCPKYIKTTLSDVLDNKINLKEESRVKVLVDIPINFEESTLLRQKFLKDKKLREFVLEESQEAKAVLTGLDIDPKDIHLTSVNEAVVQLLESIKSDEIDSKTLVNIYKEL